MRFEIPDSNRKDSFQTNSLIGIEEESSSNNSQNQEAKPFMTEAQKQEEHMRKKQKKQKKLNKHLELQFQRILVAYQRIRLSDSDDKNRTSHNLDFKL